MKSICHSPAVPNAPFSGSMLKRGRRLRQSAGFVGVLILIGLLGCGGPREAAVAPEGAEGAELLLATAATTTWDEPDVCEVGGDPKGDWCEPVGNDLNVTLKVEFAETRFAGMDVKLRSYNGKLAGPTLKFKAGSKINLHLINNLGERHMRKLRPRDTTKYDFNTTNLHTHGLHISPYKSTSDSMKWSDNVLLAIHPVGSRDDKEKHYRFDISTDLTHAGTHWYHPHRHGSTAIQVASGMTGALIFQGPVDQIRGIKDAKDRLFLFQQFGDIDEDEGTLDDFDQVTEGEHTAINGRLKPKFYMEAGAVERWRFVHAGITQGLRLSLRRGSRDCASSSDITWPFHQIAIDGLTLTEKSIVNEVRMYPGYRTDVMVRIPEREREGTTFCLVHLGERDTEHLLFPKLGRTKPQVLAVVEVKGQRSLMPLPNNRDLKRVAKEPLPCPSNLVAQQTMIFNQKENKRREECPRNNVDCKLFSMDRQRTLILDRTETWSLTSQNDHHPFHIHVNPFTVCRENNQRVKEPYWRDTIFIREGSVNLVRSQYTEHTGRFVLHCHILAHEDLGMMELVEIKKE